MLAKCGKKFLIVGPNLSASRQTPQNGRSVLTTSVLGHRQLNKRTANKLTCKATSGDPPNHNPLGRTRQAAFGASPKHWLTRRNTRTTAAEIGKDSFLLTGLKATAWRARPEFRGLRRPCGKAETVQVVRFLGFCTSPVSEQPDLRLEIAGGVLMISWRHNDYAAVTVEAESSMLRIRRSLESKSSPLTELYNPATLSAGVGYGWADVPTWEEETEKFLG
ncbi:hypothetical protein B0H16DRAFT_1465919 [Mycena metata]|uniref:Uncharacterized protein n=1 Tax=Mycena metata TaxID=1033252 RepID=A0AAD7I9P7_9AGAR|nr:hypothetical protein B0H16DRAFT_1465919 [Mycena metata]